MLACAERRREGPDTKLSSRGWARSFTWRAWPSKPRARRGTLPFWLVVSSVPHYKSSSIYALSLYGTNHYSLLPISSSSPCQASCVDSKTIHQVYNLVLFMDGHAVPSTLLSSWDNFFGDFKIRMLMRDVHASTKNCWALNSWKVLSVDWSCSVWMRWYKLQPGLCCKQFGDFFLDRWEMFVPHPLTKNPDSCQALLNFIEWWLMMSHLNEVIQVAARSLAASTSVTFISTDERCSFFIPWEKIPTAVKHFWISLSDDWSCFVWMRLYKLQSGLQLQAIQWLSSWQMRDVRSSSLHRKSRQLSSTFEFYWVMTDHVLLEWAFTGYDQVFSCKQLLTLTD